MFHLFHDSKLSNVSEFVLTIIAEVQNGFKDDERDENGATFVVNYRVPRNTLSSA